MDFTLYTAGTPNGWKISIALEELKFKYRAKSVDLSGDEQKEAWFLSLNPNGKIPVLVDHTKDDLPVFESGAILLYLADQDPQEQLLPKAVPERAKVLSWLFLQMAALGPMQGQLNAFLRYLPGEYKVATERFISETERLYTVLEKQLENRLWLAADRFTVADIAFFPWVYMHDYCGISVAKRPNLAAWIQRMLDRPAVLRGLDVPSKNPITSARGDPKKMEELVELARKKQMCSLML